MFAHLRRGARLTLTAIVGLSLVVGFGSSAQADSHDVSGAVGSVGNTGTTPGNSNTGGSTSGGGIGTGTPAYTYINMKSIPVGLPPGTGMQGGCSSTNGSNGLYIGYKFTYRTPYGTTRAQLQNWLGAGSAEMALVSRTSEQCLYSASWSDSRILCVLSLQADISMTVPKAQNLATKNYKTAFGNSQTLANCITGPSAIDVGTSISAYGRYSFSGEYSQVACVHRVYTSADMITGVKPADALLNCGSAYTQTVNPQFWQLDCLDGFSNSWHGNPSWTGDDCKGRVSATGSTWTCTAPSANFLNGLQTDSATLFRDNNLNPVIYGTSQVTGTGVVVTSSKSNVMRAAGGTPWNSFGHVASNSNNFSVERNGRNVFANDTSTYAVDGITGSGWFLAGNWASDAGSSTVTTAKFHNELLLDSVSINIAGVDIASGTALTTTSTTQVATSGDCYSNPLTVSFVRAVTVG